MVEMEKTASAKPRPGQPPRPARREPRPRREGDEDGPPAKAQGAQVPISHPVGDGGVHGNHGADDGADGKITDSDSPRMRMKLASCSDCSA